MKGFCLQPARSPAQLWTLERPREVLDQCFLFSRPVSRLFHTETN